MSDSEDSGQVLAPEGGGYVLIFQLVGHVDHNSGWPILKPIEHGVWILIL